MTETASLLIHYHAQVPVKKKAKIYMLQWLQSSHFAKWEICKCWPDEPREYTHLPYFYVFLSIVTTSTKMQKAKQMGWNKHCH